MELLPLLSDDYLFSRWEQEYREFIESGEDATLLERLRNWANRDITLTETQLEGQFNDLFFKQTWDYWGTGERDVTAGFCMNPQYGVDGAGQGGGRGAADLALGWFGRAGIPQVPQVLCEFKDIRSALDAPQKRKGNDRSPVKQCFDYLKYAFDQIGSHSPIVPTWGIITDMNEFRLYSRRVGDSQFQRFIIRSSDDRSLPLVEESREAAFQRFLFQKLFHRELLLATYGKSCLEKLLEEQWVREKELEKSFYREYQAYRKYVFETIVITNPEFRATRGKLVRLTQRFLDRCIFILFCEDMGNALEFPTNLLRDILDKRSTDKYYDPDSGDIWELVKRLFRSMRDGGDFPPEHVINRFNGGLFEELPELENLKIPNRIFCARGQGLSPETLTCDKETLLYLAANYNFGAAGTKHERTISLYVLGRIFEQSITELEYMEAEVEGRESIASLTKRKRDGVYYTPEWVTDYIVKETVGARLADVRKELRLELGAVIPEDVLKTFRQQLSSKKKLNPNNPAGIYLRTLDEYENALNRLKILDPACGSGAFLIQALQFLLRERRTIAEERERITGNKSLFDVDESMRLILSQNLYGVDINQESVEITQLAMWLNTALPGKPLSNLEKHIRCGNSLVSSDFETFYQKKHPEALFADLDEQTRENVNVFDWERAFPEILGPEVPEEIRGFDCVIGNPPYVKLQHFRRLKQDESDYLSQHSNPKGERLYICTQQSNFDLYLPFIEKGINLMSNNGRMGYIAPNIWIKSNYGKNLREWLSYTKTLDRWVDLDDYQVFDEAITYTAIQFYSKSGASTLRFKHAPNGPADLPRDDAWQDIESIDYEMLSGMQTWNLQPKHERDLMNKFRDNCTQLGALRGITVGFRGIETGGDRFFRFTKIGSNLYMRLCDGDESTPVVLDDNLLKPLVSGPQAKRYIIPQTPIYVLFPWKIEGNKPRLLTEKELSINYPTVWDYLKKNESELRAREHGYMDRDDCWWGYNRPMNLEKQEKPKLGIAQTVQHMQAFHDREGAFFFNNVRVGGILYGKNELFGWWLLGVLNAPVIDYVFRRISKRKEGGYFEANRQYLSPLPIPNATDEEMNAVGERAKILQNLHTARRDKVASLQQRLNSSQCFLIHLDEEWLWADLKTLDDWIVVAPAELAGKQKTTWAKMHRTARLENHFDKVEAVLRPGAPMTVREKDGEVTFLVGRFPVAEVYLEENDADFIAAQWRQVTRMTNITEKFKAKTLVKLLLSINGTENQALRNQVIKLDREIIGLDSETETAEHEMNELVYRLYRLTDQEIKLIEED